MFRELTAHSQEVLYKRHLLCCFRVMSVGFIRIGVELWSPVQLQSWCSQLTLHAHNIPSAVCSAPPKDEQVMLEKGKGKGKGQHITGHEGSRGGVEV
jgi:hypothetical protein